MSARWLGVSALVVGLSSCRGGTQEPVVGPPPGPPQGPQAPAPSTSEALPEPAPGPAPGPALDPAVERAFDETAELIRLRREKRASLADHYVREGKLHVEREEFRLALASYDKALELDPDNAEAIAGRRLAQALAEDRGR